MTLLFPLLLAASLSGATTFIGPPELVSLEVAGPVLPAAVEDEEEATGWSGALALGAYWSGGNTRTDGVHATLDAEHRRISEEIDDRTTFGALFIESENRIHDVTNEDRWFAKAQYDYFFSEKTYGLLQASYGEDEVAALDSRITAGAGAGRQFREDAVLKLSGEAGLSWLSEEYSTGQDSDDIVLRAAYGVDWKINETWELGQTTAILPVIDDVTDVYATVDTRLKLTFSESIFGQLQWLLQHDETPAAGKDKTDHRIQFAVGWSF